MAALLEVDGVTKLYGARRAVESISFTVKPGAVYGVLGPNGAGKSTMMRMLVGVLTPDAGRVSMDAAPITRAAQRRIGFLPEERGLYRNMTPRAVITYFARLKGMKAGAARRQARALLEAHGLADRGRKKIKTLSKGLAQKVQLLAAIAHDPDVMVLDEPFSGLDPVNQQSLETMIRERAQAGATVVFSTHIMEHAERVCDRILLIANGRAAFEGRVSEALALAPRFATLETDAAFDLQAALAPAGFAAEPIATEFGARPRWRVALPSAEAGGRLLRAAVAAGAPLTAFEPSRETLHDAFVSLVSAAAPRQGEAGGHA